MRVAAAERRRSKDNGHSSAVGAESIQRELDKVLTSHLFSQSKRLSRFLRFIVEQAIAGRSEKLKEYVLGVEVFDRTQAFDQRTDPIVRVEAGRLRAKLRDYYRREGRDDDVRIECFKGSYAPLFRAQPSSTTHLRQKRSSTLRPRKDPTVAVLPFTDLSPEKDQEYFCDGITEELIGVLTKVEGIRVVSRTSAFAFKGKNQDVREIGKQLNVSVILEGSVRKQGDRLRIAAQLTDVVDGFELWSETHERASEDVFVIQDEISHSIVENLKIKLLGHKTKPLVKRHTEDPEAYRLYLKGRYHWNKRTEDALRSGIQYFEEAIAENPNYALPYAGLADSYAILGNRGALAPKDAMPKAKAAALKALEIDAELAEAHASLGLVNAVYDWDWTAAEQQFRRAIALNQRYATAYHWYALNCLTPMGRLDEAVQQIQRAEQLDPVSLVIGTVKGQLFCFKRQYDDAIEQLRRTIRLDANFYLAHWHLGLAYAQKAMFSEAIASLETARTLSKGSPFILGSLGQTYAWSGDKVDARKLLEELRGLSSRRYVCSTEIARIYAALSEEDQVYEWLGRACEERAVSVVHLHVDPTYDGLRRHARFVELLKRVGLQSR